MDSIYDKVISNKPICDVLKKSNRKYSLLIIFLPFRVRMSKTFEIIDTSFST